MYQGESIILTSDLDSFEIKFRIKPLTILVQIRDKNGIEKNLKVVDNVVLPNGKATLKEGDVINYIGIM